MTIDFWLRWFFLWFTIVLVSLCLSALISNFTNGVAVIITAYYKAKQEWLNSLAHGAFEAMRQREKEKE